MGWETDVSSVFNAIQTGNNMNAAIKTSNAQALAGAYQANNIADNTARQAGTIQSSFLQGGISLAGGPSAVLAQVFAKGNTDVSRTISNADAQASNTVNAARTNSLNAISQQLLKASGGSNGISSAVSSATFGTDSVNGLGQTLGSALDPSPVGPYISPL